MLTELYECVNEARFFKFWSRDQKPRTEIKCHACKGLGKFQFVEDAFKIGMEECTYCDGTGIQEKPLLEEYVDTIHFALSIANDLGYTNHKYIDPGFLDLNELTIGLTNLITLIPEAKFHRHIETVFNYLIKLGYQLGFDEETVIRAYFEKNKVNHERQAQGY